LYILLKFGISNRDIVQRKVSIKTEEVFHLSTGSREHVSGENIKINKILREQTVRELNSKFGADEVGDRRSKQ